MTERRGGRRPAVKPPENPRSGRHERVEPPPADPPAPKVEPPDEYAEPAEVEETEAKPRARKSSKSKT